MSIPLPSELDVPLYLDFAEEMRQWEMRQAGPTPWPATPSPRSLVKFKCPSGSEGKRESELGGDYSENKRECSESMGGETASRDYLDLSQLQISDLDIGTFHQNELQLPQLTDLDVVGVEDFKLPRPVELEEDQFHQDVEHRVQQEVHGDGLAAAHDGEIPRWVGLEQDQDLLDQEDYLLGVHGGAGWREEEQLLHLKEVHVVGAQREPEMKRDQGRGH